MSEPTLQDFSLVRTFVKKIRNDLNLSDAVSAFYYFLLDSILKLQENEIDDSITDSNYLSLSGKPAGHDIGIDALYIDSTTSPTTVHIFNYKYTEQFEKLDNNYSASEIDKLLSFFRSLCRTTRISSPM